MIERVKGMTMREADTIRQLDAVCFPSDDRIMPWERATRWWIAWDGNVPVAFAGVKRWPGPYGFLLRCGVVPEARGGGLQKRLLRVREADSRLRGIAWLMTYVHPHSHASLNSLVSRGYRFYQPSNPWAGARFLYLRKEL